jgi:hypothetical protein
MATAVTATSHIISAEQVAFTDEQWADCFDYDLGTDPDNYAASVLAAAWDRSESLILTDRELGRLLRNHEANVADLKADSHPEVNPNHAGQALVWLGY